MTVFNNEELFLSTIETLDDLNVLPVTLVENALESSVDTDVIYDMLNYSGYEIDYIQSNGIGHYKIQCK